MHAALQAALGGSRGTADGILLDLGVSSMQVGAASCACLLAAAWPCAVADRFKWWWSCIRLAQVAQRSLMRVTKGVCAIVVCLLAPVMLTIGEHRATGLNLDAKPWQLDQAERGFSFMRDGPLDMRMGGGGPGVELNGGPGAAALNPLSAEALVNTADEAELGRMIRYWGEERGWRRIAARCETRVPVTVYAPLCCVHDQGAALAQRPALISTDVSKSAGASMRPKASARAVQMAGSGLSGQEL